MTNEFRALLHLTGAAALGKKNIALDETVDWQKLERLAKEQGVEHLVGYALRLSPGISCPDDVRKRMVSAMRQAAFSNNAWKASALRLLEDLRGAGFSPILVKGYAVASCYAAPDSRLSGDTDVLIDPKEERRAVEFMRKKGFKIIPRWENGHHTVCDHPQIGRFELHVLLYDEIVEDIWFGRKDGREFILEQSVRVDTPEGSYDTLGYTDHMVFLMLHLIKHFIMSGMSLRMMLDTALFFIGHAEKIDSERLWRTMRELQYEKLAQSILWAMVQYCGLDAGRIPGLAEEQPDQLEAIIDDLEAGGWLGVKDHEQREEGWHEYNRRVLMKEKSKGQYLLYMLKWRRDSYLKSFFPGREALAKHYPYVMKSPALIPFAWLHRLFFRGTKAIRRGALTKFIVIDENKVSQSGKNRVELFRKMGML